jgi:hypothetical protein
MTETQHRPGTRNPGGADDLLVGGVGTEDIGPRAAVLRMYKQARARSKQDSAVRRARVLAHPDLARRLTDPPLRLSDPSRWSGWIPPKTLAEECCVHCAGSNPRPPCRGCPHRTRANDSPIRRQLVEIVAEALRRASDQ